MRLFRKAFVTAPRDTAASSASADRTRPPKRPRAERVFGDVPPGRAPYPDRHRGVFIPDRVVAVHALVFPVQKAALRRTGGPENSVLQGFSHLLRPEVTQPGVFAQ